MRALLVLLPIPLLAACSHSIPRVPPDYTDEVLARYPRPEFIAPPTTAERLADAVIRPVKPDRPALPEFEPLMIPAGIRNTKDGLYLDVWFIGEDAESLGRALSADLNIGGVWPPTVFRITVNGVEHDIAPPIIEGRDFHDTTFQISFFPPVIDGLEYATRAHSIPGTDPRNPPITIRPVMIRGEPILAETCTVEVLGPIQTRRMQTALKGRSATVPVLR